MDAKKGKKVLMTNHGASLRYYPLWHPSCLSPRASVVMVLTTLLAVTYDESKTRSAILRYKYVAPRLSLCERLYLDQFWNMLAQRIYPPWLAPNLITLLGGLCIVAAAALSAYTSPSMSAESPYWVYATNACLLFAYQSLDGSDGKQARKTHSGSALGELMDHGVDSFAVGLIGFFTIDQFGFGIGSLWPWVFLIGAQASFLISNMTLFHIGQLRINNLDVIELQTCMIGSLLLTSVMGPRIWADVTLPFVKVPAVTLETSGLLKFDWSDGIPVRDAFAVVCLVNMSTNILVVCASIVRHLCAVSNTEDSAQQDGSQRNGADASMKDAPCAGFAALRRQLTFVAAYFCVCAWCVRGCLNIARTDPQLSHGLLLLLWMLCMAAWGGDVVRHLALKVGHIPLPVVSRSLAYVTLFGVAVNVAGAQQPDLVGMAAKALLGMAMFTSVAFFGCATSAIAKAVGLHPFRVRGAKHWYSLD